METSPKIKKKILLIQPTIYDDHRELVKKSKLYFIDLATPLLAAICGDDWEVDICSEVLEEIPWNTDAELIGISGMGNAFVRAVDIATKFKEMGKTVIMGGYMASLIPEEAQKYCNAVLIGDAEGCLQELLNDYLNGNLKPVYQKTLTSLSTPMPKYELIVKKKIGDFLPVQAGRGCPNCCSFCSIACLYKSKYLCREIPEVIRDIRKVKDLGFKKFLLIDDNIISDRQYAMDLCNEIKKLKMEWYSQCSILLAKDPELLRCMADSGCVTLSFGIESISQSNLKKVNKAWCKIDEYEELIKTIHEAGIDVATEMMVGMDDDTEDSLRETVKFVIKNKVESPKFYILTPIPGTPYYNQIKNSGDLVNPNFYEYGPSKAVKNSRYLKTDEIDRLYWELYKNVYSIKNIFKRIIFTKRFFRHPQRSLFNFGVNLFYRYHIQHGISPMII
jgi:radical SAM superfamily enzyme YgiQ (UPF0313 family)